MPEPHIAARSRTLPEPRQRSLSVVVPVLNEERGLAALIGRLVPVLESLGLDWEVIFVDDGSADGTLAELQAANARDQQRAKE
jgi:glycosyltransferase involved in cell wall biosynthesis